MSAGAPERDPHDLGRFLAAQDPVYEQVLEELRSARKRSHWMWFVFPQIAGLGSSATARRYAIGSLEEARAYLADPLLGTRLHECAQALLEGASRHGESSPEAILGAIDALKLRSCMTLFHRADPDDQLFPAVLERLYGGHLDPETERLLQGPDPVGA
jgi:uncharacterized protein (DUF1810 family)